MEWSRQNPGIVAQIDGEGLHFKDFNFTRAAPSLRHSVLSTTFSCFKFSPQQRSGGLLMAVGSEAPNTSHLNTVHLLEYSTGPVPRCSAVLNLSARRGARCRAVSWSSDGTKLAAGFDKEGGRDNGVVLFDLGSATSSMPPMAPTPFSSLAASERSPASEEHLSSPNPAIPNKQPSGGGAYGESAVALTWLPHDLQQQVLVVGSNKWLRLWDTRQPYEKSSRYLANQKGAVAGFKPDPLRPSILAAFSDGALDPVNIYDVRKLQSSAPPLAVVLPWHSSSSSSGGGFVTDIAWSPKKAGVLATVQSDANGISLWNSTQSGEIKVPDLFYSTPSPCHHITWAANGPFGFDHLLLYACRSPTRPTPSSRVKGLSRDLLEVADLRGFEALAFNRASGCTASAVGRGAISIKSTSEASRENTEEEDVDVSLVMKTRASKGYSTEAGRNLQVLAGEEDEGSLGRQRDLRALTNMWSWVERLEQNPSWDISRSGVVPILESVLSFDGVPGANENAVRDVVDPVLRCSVFQSAARNEVLGLCGWAPLVGNHFGEAGLVQALQAGESSLQQVMEESESMGEFERSAALAVFHGDLRAALDALQRSSDHLHVDFSSLVDEEDSESTVPKAGRHPTTMPTSQQERRQYQNVVAMCIAGFSAAGTSQASQLWGHMCRPLAADQRGHPYLRAACGFLLEISARFAHTASERDERSTAGHGEGGGRDSATVDSLTSGGVLFSELLRNETLTLDDRTAFAARYLPPAMLASFCSREQSSNLKEGKLDGLLLFDVLSEGGLELMQAYLDRTGDVATLALIASRVAGFRGDGAGTGLLDECTESYRDLLDEWEMWEERASLDVARSELMRQHSTHQGAMAAAEAEEPGQFVRCNFCSVVLPLVSLARQASLQNKSWLQGQKPVLSCCPSCRNHLPKCYVCLLSLGGINPYLELKRTGGGGAAAAKKHDGGLEEMSTLNFGSWFTWCQVCKHGGHADHINSWFESHAVCGVSGCDCRCCAM